MRCLKIVLLVIGLLMLAPAWAQEQMEIMSLQHRLPEQVLPVLQPMLAPGGRMSAMSGKLIVRTSVQNLAEIRAALAAIDQPLRRLTISVRQGGGASREATQLGAAGRVRIDPDGVRPELTLEGAQGRVEARDNIVSRVQTVEDGEALIQIGRAAPVMTRRVIRGPDGVWVEQGSQYVEANSGFVARARLVGDEVIVAVAPQTRSLGADGRVSGSSARTELRGRLGEWMPLGGVSQQTQREAGGWSGYEARRGEQFSNYWIRVEELR